MRVTLALTAVSALNIEGSLMPLFTSRAGAKIPASLLLGLVTVVSGAAEQHDTRVATDTTHNSGPEDSPGRWRGQLCLVGSRNCLSLDRRPLRLCLLSPQRCDIGEGRIERLELTR
jgi:hypothetical protein